MVTQFRASVVTLAPCVVTCLLAFLMTAEGTLLPHGSATSLALHDDFLHSLALPGTVYFHGSTYSTLYISDNGLVTFDSSLFQTPNDYSTVWIAAFCADVISMTSLKQQVFDSTTPTELRTVTTYINNTFPTASFTATHAYVITWIDAEFAAAPSQLNTMQVAIATDGASQSYALLLLDTINYYNGKVGVSAGDGTDYYSVCHVNSADAQFLPEKSNHQCTGTPGVFVFRIDWATSWTSANYECTSVYRPTNCESNTGESECDSGASSPTMWCPTTVVIATIWITWSIIQQA